MNFSSTTQWCIDKGKPGGRLCLPSNDCTPDDLGSSLLRKVLVVDDEVELADLAAILLNSYGLETITAYSALEALRILATDSDIDAVFSDVVMPEMTGFQLADAIRDAYPRIKIVLTSGFTRSGTLAESDRSYLFASKPYRIETLLKLLRS